MLGFVWSQQLLVFAFQMHGKGSDMHKNRKKIEEISIRDFADQLAFDLLNNNFEDGGSSTTITILSPLMDSPQRQSPRLARKESLVVEVTETSISPLTKSTSSKIQYYLMWAKMM